MRSTFFNELFLHMLKNPDIILIVGGLGYGGIEKIKKEFPNRFYNFESAEQAIIMSACGLVAVEKIPVVYSITPFIIFRPIEMLRNYVNNENIPIKIVGSGRDFDYRKDNISHWSHDVKFHLDLFSNIKQYWPKTKEEILPLIDEFINNNQPCFLSLKR